MKWCTSLILFFICHNCIAQSFENIETFTTKNGLSNNTVTCLEKDEDGFLWIGTNEGLNQYDGTEFNTILSNSKNNLPSNFINKICCVNKTTLVVATAEGTCLLDTKTLQGKVIELPGKANSDKDPLEAWDILYDKKENEIWIATSNGLYVFSIEGKLKRGMKADKTKPVNAVFARNLFKDRFGNIFFHSDRPGGGFFYPDFNKNQLVPVEQRMPEFTLNKIYKQYAYRSAVFIDNKITCCFTNKDVNSKKNLLCYYDNATGYNMVDSFTVSNVNSYFINNAYPLNDSLLLINSFFGEPYYYSLHTRQIRRVADHPLWFASWPDGIIVKLLVEKDNIWVATSKGLLQVPQYIPIFKTNSVLVNRIHTNKSLVSFNSGLWHHGKFWISCLGAGVFSLDTFSNKVKAVFDENTPAKFYNKVISKELIETGNSLWLFSVYGPALINETTMKPEAIVANNKDSVFDTQAHNPLKDSKGNIWMSLLSGIVKYTIATNSLFNYKNKNAGGKFPLERSLFKTEDGKGNIWFARQDTLLRFDPVTESSSFFYLKKNGIPLKPVLELASDGKDLLYMYLKEAFGIYHISTGEIELYTKQTGIVSTAINQMAVDKNGDPWIATEGGLVHYDSRLKQFHSYTKADGLPDNNIGSINFTDDSKTELFLGFPASYCLFNLEKLLQKKNETVRNTITGVEVSGEAIAFNDKTILSYQDNSISFSYTGINFNAGPQNSYAYMLEGFDKVWKYSGKKRQSSYVNLPPGDYTFKIKSANQQGEWNETPATFSFTIASPFWQTLWFRLLAVAVSILLIYFFIKRRDKVKEKENQLQLQLMELRLQAVQSQMNPHFIFNSLNSIQNFIVQNNQIEAARYLSKFSKLIRRILDNSNHQFLKLEDIVETLKMYVELEAFRFNKEFTYEFNVDKNDQRIYDVLLPPMLLQPFVENAILHGLMPKEGPKHLLIDFFIANDTLHCIIEDNGMGRKEKSQSKHISRGEKLTRDMLESMKLIEKAEASITYEDLKDANNDPSGTKVIIKIPVEK